MTRNLSRYGAIVLSIGIIMAVLTPGMAHASAQGPLQSIPGWLQDALDSMETALAKTLQDTARVGGVLLWGILKVCGMVGLFGNDFSALFGTVITEALNAVITGQVHDLIRGSLMVSLGLFGLSLLARPFWPDLKLVSFQRAAIWGIVIQAYLLNAPAIYTELETWRVGLSEQVAGAVSTGAIPGCSGNVVEMLLCITGTSTAEVVDPDLAALPDQIPYGGSESVRDLYDHCVYNPPALYGQAACDPDTLLGDPWQVLTYAQDALGAQLLGLILAFLILTYGILQISLGLAAGMMFVLFPIAALFAFYLPLESFPAGVIRNYISIFLKSVVLLTLAGVVIRLFSVAAGGPSGGSLAAMAAVALVDLLLCLVMAKEALASLLSSFSFVGTSVGSLGASVGLSGGGAPAALPGPESRVAASMIGGGSVAQTLMGAPSPYPGGSGSGGALGAAGRAMGAPARSARTALQTALAAGTGGAGAVAGIVAAAKGAGYGSLALMGNAATTVLGRNAGRGFMTGAGLVATGQSLRGKTPGRGTGRPARSPFLVPVAPPAPSPGTAPTATTLASPPSILPADPGTGAPVSNGAIQSMLLRGEAGDSTGSGLSPRPDDPRGAMSVGQAGAGQTVPNWTPGSARQIRQAANKLEPASPDAENAAFDLSRAGHQQALRWEREGRNPILTDGTLKPQFVEEVVQREPDAATTLVAEQAGANLPAGQRLGVGEAVALGVTRQRTVPAGQVRQGFARAIGAVGPDRDLNTALQDELGVGARTIFGQQAGHAEQVARQVQGAGLANDLGSRLVETVGEGLAQNPRLTPQQFREGYPDRMDQWDQATGDPQRTDRIVGGLIGLGPLSQATVQEIPRPPREPAPQAVLEAAPSSAPEPDPALFEQLRTWRLAAAREADKKAFYVFPDATLKRIAAARPQTPEELRAVSGVGPKKLAQYGQAVLDITRQGDEE